MLEILFVFGRNKDCTLKDPLLYSDLSYPLVAFHKPQALPAKSSTCQPTYTLSSITSVPWWTGSTFISTGISRWRKISAINSRVTRLTIHFAGINVPVTEPPCVTSLTFTAHVYKLAVSIICVAFFWFYALTIMLAGAHFDGRTPNGAGILVVNSNESQTELRGEKTILWTFLSFIFLVQPRLFSTIKFTFSENDYSLCSLAVMHMKPLSRFSCRSALASFDWVRIVDSGPYENGYMTIHRSEIITSQRFPK